MDAKELGQFIATLRKEKNITQVELAKTLNVTDKAISRWERGLGFPDINTLEPLAKALGISLIELMQSKKNIPDASISTEKAEEILLNTIQLSNKTHKTTKIIGCIILSILAIFALLSFGVLLTDWNALNYIVISILAGLVAWGVPVWKITLSRKSPIFISSFISFSCALMAIVFQIINIAHDIHMSDTIAVLDTIDAIVVISCLFVGITLILNIIMILSKRK